MKETLRTVAQLIPGRMTSDGAGVRLRRSIGSQAGVHIDPFLMLDEFSSDNPDDYIAGFPDHPHRGFETVTYMLDGHMLHQDHLGNRGDLRSGDVQWMTAGRGIIHSEIPQQTEGRMRGFQLWLNLPAAEKMKPANYRDIPAADIPVVRIAGGSVKVIAGSFQGADGSRVDGAVTGSTTRPVYLDVHLDSNAAAQIPVPAGHNAFLYSYEGELSVGEEAESRAVPKSHAAWLTDGSGVALTAGPEGARFLLLAGKPLKEPVVQYGPFVMNTREEIEQTLRDFQSGRFASA